jgi:hypothetical protein
MVVNIKKRTMLYHFYTYQRRTFKTVNVGQKRVYIRGSGHARP